MHSNVLMPPVLLIVILCFVCTSASLLASQAREKGEAVFIYPKHVYSERDLSECPGNTACSVVYRRYWLPPLVERHCRCPHGQQECQWSWSKATDNRTLPLDNRTQLKFCTNMQKLPNCARDETALRLDSDLLHHTTSKPRSTRMKVHRFSDTRSITVFCNCPNYHRWELQADSQSKFRCATLDACTKFEVCGFIRTDMHSTAYQCSCPVGQQCVTQNKETHYRQLVFYDGPVYKAYCTRVAE